MVKRASCIRTCSGEQFTGVYEKLETRQEHASGDPGSIQNEFVPSLFRRLSELALALSNAEANSWS